MFTNNNEWGKQVRIALGIRKINSLSAKKILEEMTLKDLAELIEYSPSYVRAVVGGKLNGIEKVQQKINDALNINDMQVD